MTVQKETSKDQFGSFEIIKPKGFVDNADVSVVMSVFNGEKFLAKSIDSILGQSFDNFEFIIVNDGSEDNSLNIAIEYQKLSNRILIIDQENMGLTKALIRAIGISRGRYIARQDADDISLEERLEKQFDFLESNSDYFIAGCNYNVIDVNSNLNGNPEISVPIEDRQIKFVINRYNPFAHSFVMFRNDLSKLGHFYDPKYKYSQNYELWTRVQKHYKMYNIPQILGLSRQWPGMISEDKIKTQRRYALRVKKQIMLNHITNIGFWYYLLKDLSVVYLPGSFRQIYRKLAGK